MHGVAPQQPSTLPALPLLLPVCVALFGQCLITGLKEREKISAMVFWKKQCRTQEVCEGTAGPIKWSSVRSKDGDIYLNSRIFRLESHG